jgi:hypothetical protein
MPNHGRANLFLDLVDDRVETNVDCFLLREHPPQRFGRTLKPMITTADDDEPACVAEAEQNV